MTFEVRPPRPNSHIAEDDVWLAEREALEREPLNAVAVDRAPRRWQPTMKPLSEFFRDETRNVEEARRNIERFEKMTPPQQLVHWRIERRGSLIPATQQAFPFRASLAIWRRP